MFSCIGRWITAEFLLILCLVCYCIITVSTYRFTTSICCGCLYTSHAFSVDPASNPSHSRFSFQYVISIIYFPSPYGLSFTWAWGNCPVFWREQHQGSTTCFEQESAACRSVLHWWKDCGFGKRMCWGEWESRSSSCCQEKEI